MTSVAVAITDDEGAPPPPPPTLPHPTASPSEITDAWQVQIRGLVMGPGTPYRLVGIEKLRARTVRAADTDRPGAHGSRATQPDRLESVPRVLTVSWGDGLGMTTPGDVWALLETLERAWALGDDVPLTFIAPTGTTLTLFGRTRPYEADLTRAGVGYAEADLEFDALDPRWYGPEQTGTMTPATKTGGHVWPQTYPNVWGEVNPGRLTVLNGGTAPAPWMASLRADSGDPVVNPEIENQSTGERLALNGVTVPAGGLLTYESIDGRVLLGGIADRDGLLTVDSSWWDLPPGDEIDLRFGSDSGVGSLTMTWRDAYG